MVTRGETAFEKVVLFERNSALGGVWCGEARGANNNDQQIPESRDFEDWNKPEKLFVKASISSELEKKLSGSSYEDPVIVKKPKSGPEDKFQWRSSAAYKGLFTNVPNKYMTFSFQELNQSKLDHLKNKYRWIPDFQSAEEVTEYLRQVVEDNDLAKYARTNSNVERVRKLNSGKWELIVRSTREEEDGTVVDTWYRQEADALVIANGKSVPIIPHFKNLLEFAHVNKGKVIITLAKSLKDPSFLKKSKKILIVGSSVSCVDIIQYAFPRDLSKRPIIISRRAENCGLEWIDYCAYSKGIVNKPEIEEFLPESRGVRFKDGSEETGFDAVIITTGYHSFYPFFEDSYASKHPDLFYFYRYTFSIDDSSLALVGNTYALFFFSRVEVQGAALAGVWSGDKSLPPIDDQKTWYQNEFDLPMLPFIIKKRFIDPLALLALDNRPHPFESESKVDFVKDTCSGWRELQTLFYKIKDEAVNVSDVI
ncbi:hypothetical protein FOA43_001606 [Brettanomyces nanus]|uniref:Uncharacterized protein n=1 Tax=Eeniella nana TaxID=13502 RepID=A0A875RXS0_EENNA|nr:uncharacterized protein FOA43_001606 [Brettanomyces nanus]QPG74281.1 hypothetical protein FOA43_001606 [Brettanomyces nanus]